MDNKTIYNWKAEWKQNSDIFTCYVNDNKHLKTNFRSYKFNGLTDIL